jgi:hypothetical protein
MPGRTEPRIPKPPSAGADTGAGGAVSLTLDWVSRAYARTLRAAVKPYAGSQADLDDIM